MSKKSILVVVIASYVFFAGCAGREAHPVAIHQIGDDNRTCKSLELEIAQNDVLIMKKMKKDKSKFWSNAFWLIWFAPVMDVKEAEKTEAEALRARNNYLRILNSEKDCKYMNTQLTTREATKIEKKRKLIGYRARTEYPSGKIITTPVYEENEP